MPVIITNTTCSTDARKTPTDYFFFLKSGFATGI